MTALGVTGSLTTSDPTITLLDPVATYGDVDPGVERSCTALADCYVVQPAASRPSQHCDIVVHEALATGDEREQQIPHVGNRGIGEKALDVLLGQGEEVPGEHRND